MHCHRHVVGSGPGGGDPAKTRQGMAARGHNLMSEGKGHMVNARVEPLGVHVWPCVCGSVASRCGRRWYEKERGRCGERL